MEYLTKQEKRQFKNNKKRVINSYNKVERLDNESCDYYKNKQTMEDYNLTLGNSELFSVITSKDSVLNTPNSNYYINKSLKLSQ